MRNELQTIKTFAGSQREKLRETFARRAAEPPIVDPFSAASMQKWEEYCDEMRFYEIILSAEGLNL